MPLMTASPIMPVMKNTLHLILLKLAHPGSLCKGGTFCFSKLYQGVAFIVGSGFASKYLRRRCQRGSREKPPLSGSDFELLKANESAKRLAMLGWTKKGLQVLPHRRAAGR